MPVRNRMNVPSSDSGTSLERKPQLRRDCPSIYPAIAVCGRVYAMSVSLSAHLFQVANVFVFKEPAQPRS